MSASPLILHIPHSSVAVPPEERASLLLDDIALVREILAMTDMHTEALYDVPGAARVVFPVSRLVVDPERFRDDAFEPMASRGMGVIYTRGAYGAALREPPGPGHRRRLLETWYDPHHARLSAVLRAAKQAFGFALIADCHSFPSKTLPYEDADAPRPEICIGTDGFHTPAELSAALTEALSLQGYEVRLNTPFSGALTPLEFYKRDARVFSAMIEVRRDLYMDEATGKRNDRFEAVAADLRRALEDAVRSVDCVA